MQQTGMSEEQILLISKFALTSIGPQEMVGGLVVAGLVSYTFAAFIVSSDWV